MARHALVILLVVLAFGVLVPWFKGFAFLDPRILLAYGFMALLFVVPASAEAAGRLGTQAASSDVLKSIATVVLYGWGIGIFILATGLATLNVTYWRGSIIAPPTQLLLAVVLFSFTASTMIAVMSVLLARRFPAHGVRNIMRFTFLILLLIFAFSSRMPDRWQIFLLEHSTRRAITNFAWESAAVCAILAVALMVPLLRKPAESSVA